jgi:hypothetical protein
MADFGNPLAGERNTFTGVANFIEWDEDDRPDKAYISNYSGGVINHTKKTPLISPTNRYIGLQWGPRILKPDQSFTFTLAIGMAEIDPKTGIPRKPKTELGD